MGEAGDVEDKCPYCGGDEKKCDYNWKTDTCNQMNLENDNGTRKAKQHHEACR
jgi:hypothetical protein